MIRAEDGIKYFFNFVPKKEKKTMEFKIKAKISAFLMAATIAVGAAAALPSSATYNNSGRTQRDAFTPSSQGYILTDEQYKFPAGKYWNGGNANSWTNSPCNGSHSNDNWFTQHNIYSAGYTSYLGAVNGHQCYGFAAKLASDFYGGADAWIRFTNTNNFQFRVGDIVRIGNDMHSVFITQVNGNSLKFADCNWDGHCKIRWNVSATYSSSNNKLNFGSSSYKVYWVERPVMAGDVNGDGMVTWMDMSYIYDIASGNYNFSGKPQKVKNVIKEAADLDNNGVINYTDFQIAYSYYTATYLPDQKFLTNVGNWS